MKKFLGRTCSECGETLSNAEYRSHMWDRHPETAQRLGIKRPKGGVKVVRSTPDAGGPCKAAPLGPKYQPTGGRTHRSPATPAASNASKFD